MSRYKGWIIAAIVIVLLVLAGIGIKVFAQCTTQIESGKTVTLTATPCPDSYFAGWINGPCAGSKTPACTFQMPEAPLNITARFHLKPGKVRNLRITKGCGTMQLAMVGE